MYRWLKEWGIAVASEKTMRARAKELVGSDLQAEAAPFSFPLPEGGEEIRPAPFTYILNLPNRVEKLLDENERYAQMKIIKTCTHVSIYVH